MKSAILALCLFLAPEANPFNDPDAVNKRYAQCEVIEINTYFSDDAAPTPTFVQVIFWGEDGIVQDWCFYKEGEFKVTTKEISWKVGKRTFIVKGARVTHTRTTYDPEVENRGIVAQQSRLYTFGRRLKQYPWKLGDDESMFEELPDDPPTPSGL